MSKHALTDNEPQYEWNVDSRNGNLDATGRRVKIGNKVYSPANHHPTAINDILYYRNESWGVFPYSETTNILCKLSACTLAERN